MFERRSKKRFKDSLKANLKSCNINSQFWEKIVIDRPLWRYMCRTTIDKFEQHHCATLMFKRQTRKADSHESSQCICNICGRIFGSPIGLFPHGQSHN